MIVFVWELVDSLTELYHPHLPFMCVSSSPLAPVALHSLKCSEGGKEITNHTRKQGSSCISADHARVRPWELFQRWSLLHMRPFIIHPCLGRRQPNSGFVFVYDRIVKPVLKLLHLTSSAPLIPSLPLRFLRLWSLR